MAFPREIKLDDDTKERLISYVETELVRHYAERGDYNDELIRYQRDYWAEPSQTEATFPFKGAATIIIPLAAITLEAVHARTMTTAFALNQFITAKPVSPKWSDHARPVERFLDTELIKRVKIYRPLDSSVLEIEKYGTGIAKTGYEKIVKRAVREVGDTEEEFDVTIKQGATVESIPASRFLMPFASQDPQTAPWCGEEHTSSPYDIRLMETSGMFREGVMEELAAHFTTNPYNSPNTGKEFENEQAELEHREPVWPETVDWVEIWLGFDVDQSEKFYIDNPHARETLTNNFNKEIQLCLHRPSKTILSCRYNWNQDLHRPYHTGVYFPVEHRWAGIGICKQVEQFQREITTQHRQRIDNATLANCRMIKINKLSQYGPNEPVFPGKTWFVDSMDDIETFQLGEIYPSSYSNESQALLYVQQRTGVNEVNLGMPQVGTPGTATSDLARIQEGNKKFDYVYRNIKHFMSEVVRGTVLNIKQFGPRADVYYEVVDGGDKVKEFFSQDYTLIKENLLLEISVAGQQDNKLLDRNNWQQVSQQLKDYYDGMINLANLSGQSQDPIVKLIAERGMKAATEAMQQILESFDLKNIDRIIILEALNGQLGNTPAIAAAPAGLENPEQSAGMVGPPMGMPQMSGARTNGNGAV